MSDIKTFTVVLIIVVANVFVSQHQRSYAQATGMFPQVVSCVNQNTEQPTLTVKVEPNRDPGRVKEYQVLGCRLYYHRHFR